MNAHFRFSPDISVETGVPMPGFRRNGNPAGNFPARYPWAVMDVGDSFAVPPDVNITNFRRAANAAQKVWGAEFLVHKMPDGTYRCWRSE